MQWYVIISYSVVPHKTILDLRPTDFPSDVPKSLCPMKHSTDLPRQRQTLYHLAQNSNMITRIEPMIYKAWYPCGRKHVIEIIYRDIQSDQSISISLQHIHNHLKTRL